MSGKVLFVGAGPGDPDLITVKGYKALLEADVVLYDALVDPRMVEGLDAELIYVGKRCGQHSMTQEQINELIVAQAGLGRLVVRLKGGDPNVLGRLGEEATFLAEREIEFEIVPGVTSATSAPAFAGIPLTMRGVADSFTLATAHRRKDTLDFSIPAYNPRTTVLLLMPVRTVRGWRSQLLARGYPLDLPMAFVASASRPNQQVLVTTVDGCANDVEAVDIELPAMVVVGKVVEKRRTLRWFSDEELVAPALSNAIVEVA